MEVDEKYHVPPCQGGCELPEDGVDFPTTKKMDLVSSVNGEELSRPPEPYIQCSRCRRMFLGHQHERLLKHMDVCFAS